MATPRDTVFTPTLPTGKSPSFAIAALLTCRWDTEILRRALNDPVCNTRDDITFQQCPVFQPFLRTGSCQPERGVLTETFAHNDLVPITRLPGCNPLWTSGAKPGCSPMPSDPDVSPHRAVDGPKVPAQPAVPALPTLPGWSELACVKTADNMLLNQRRSYDNSVSQTTCFDACLRSGYTYASIGRAWGSSWVSRSSSSSRRNRAHALGLRLRHWPQSRHARLSWHVQSHVPDQLVPRVRWVRSPLGLCRAEWYHDDWRLHHLAWLLRQPGRREDGSRAGRLLQL